MSKKVFVNSGGRLNQFVKVVGILLITSFFHACSSGGNQSPEEHMAKARVHIENRELMEAVIELKNALQQEANLPEARWMLGESYLKLGDGSLAYREFSSAQALGYTDPELENNLLRSLAKQGKHQEVLDRTEALVAEAGVSENVRLIRANSYLALRKLGEAESVFQQLLADNEQLVEAHLGLARVEFGRNDIKTATAHLDKALSISSDNDDIWTLKGLVGLISKDLNLAEDSFSKAVALAPYNVSAYIGLVRSQLALDKKQEAKKHLAIIEKYNKNIPIVRYFRAYLKYQEEDLEGSKVILLDILRVLPEHPEATLLLSNILYQEGNLEQVITYLSKFNQQYPLHVPAAKLLAVSYVSQNDPTRAVSVLEKIRPINPDDSQLLALLGSAYLRTGEADKGAELLERAAEISPDTAEIKTQLALSHLASGSTSQAVNELETALELNPNLYSADILLILTHIRDQNFDKAISAAESLAKKDPDNPLSYNLIGSAYVGSKSYDKARESFNAALKLKKDFLPAKFNLAALAIELEDAEAAEKQYLDILKIDDKNQKAILALAKMAGEAGDSDKMLAYLDRAKESNPEDLETRIYLVRYYQSINDFGKMLEVANEMNSIAPENPDVLFNLAKAYRFNRDLEKAKSILQELDKNFPNSINIMNEMGSVFMIDEAPDRATDIFQKILKLEPGNLEALLNLFRIRLGGKDYAAADDVINLLDKHHPESYSLFLSRGDLDFQQDKFSAAIENYKKASEKNSTRTVLFRLHAAYRASGDDDLAEKILDDWIADHPQDTEARHLSASAYEQEGDREKAIILYEKNLLEKNDDIIALNNLAWLYFQEGESKALEYAQKAYQLAPGVPEIMDTLGWILVHDNQLEKAIGLLTSALNKRPDIPSIAYHLAYALNKSGDKAGAKSLLEKTLNQHAAFEERESAVKLLNTLK